jgi:hypothetical protein
MKRAINDELGRMWKEAVMAYSRDIFLEELRKTTRNSVRIACLRTEI